MPTLIKGGRVIGDEWARVDEVANGSVASHTILPAAYALSHLDSLFDDGRKIGIWIDGATEPEQLAALIDRVALIAVRFAALNDGRGLSIAVVLRTRLGYTRELRAIGEVHEDVLHYMHRCGFDAYELPDGHDPAVALASMASYSDYYQGSVIDPRPAFRRVVRGQKTA